MRISVLLLIGLAILFFQESDAEATQRWKNGKNHATLKEILSTFAKNKSFVDSHNFKHENGKVFLSPKQYQDRHVSRSDPYPARTSNEFVPPMNVKIPDSLDWRDHDMVTSVKEEGECSSDWAFSVVGALEGQEKRRKNNVVSLSAQHIIDCTHDSEGGCAGGDVELAYAYVSNHGVYTEQEYPYVADDSGKCRRIPKTLTRRGTAGYYRVVAPEALAEDYLKIAVATLGPMSVVIDARHPSFKSYKGGVYYEPKCSILPGNRALLLVGYGTDPVQGDYWILKNSWGTSWGESGYVRISRGRQNHCGIASMATAPIPD